MKKSIKYLFGIALAVFMTACYEDPGSDILFSAEPVLEFEGSDTGTQGSYIRINDGQGIEDKFVVNLVAPFQSEAVSFTFEINSLTTAIEGIHFDFPEGKSFTIPAGSLSAEIPLIVYDDEITPDDKLQIVVSITSATAKIHPTYKDLAHQIRVVCPSELAGTYNSVSSGSTADFGPYSNVLTEITIVSAGAGSISYSLNDISFGAYEQEYGLSAPSGGFSDNCGTIIGNPSNQDQFQDPFTLSGSVDPVTGVITINWSNTYGDSGTAILTPQ